MAVERFVEINEEGYKNIGNHIYGSWTQLTLNDEEGNVITSMDLTTDTRVNFIEENGELYLTLMILGADEDVPVPSHIHSIKLFDPGNITVPCIVMPLPTPKDILSLLDIFTATIKYAGKRD